MTSPQDPNQTNEQGTGGAAEPDPQGQVGVPPTQPGWGAPPTQPGWGAPPPPPTQPGWGAPPTQPGWGAPPPPPTQPGWGAPPPPPTQPGWGAPPPPAGYPQQPGWGAPPPAGYPQQPGYPGWGQPGWTPPPTRSNKKGCLIGVAIFLVIVAVLVGGCAVLIAPIVGTDLKLQQDLGSRAESVSFNWDNGVSTFSIVLASGQESQVQDITCRIVKPDLASSSTPTAHFAIYDSNHRWLADETTPCT